MEYKGIKEGDMVEATLTSRLPSFKPQPWQEEAWRDLTYVGKCYVAWDRKRCEPCKGKGWLPPKSKDPLDPNVKCKECQARGSQEDRSNGTLMIRTIKGEDSHGPMEWSAPLKAFTTVKKSGEKESREGQREDYEMDKGKRVPPGTAKAAWIAEQKRLEKAGKKPWGDWKQWESR